MSFAEIDLAKAFNADQLDTPIAIETNAATLAAVHGFLSLALRHPEAGLRPSADKVAEFARAALQACLDVGLFTDLGVSLIAQDDATQDRTLPECVRALRGRSTQ